MPTIPIPTIGRIVLFRGHDGEDRPAIVTHVWSDLCINLTVFGKDDQDKNAGIHTSVTPGQYEDGRPFERSWRWMPYQLANPDRGASKQGPQEVPPMNPPGFPQKS